MHLHTRAHTRTRFCDTAPKLEKPGGGLLCAPGTPQILGCPHWAPSLQASLHMCPHHPKTALRAFPTGGPLAVPQGEFAVWASLPCRQAQGRKGGGSSRSRICSATPSWVMPPAYAPTTESQIPQTLLCPTGLFLFPLSMPFAANLPKVDQVPKGPPSPGPSSLPPLRPPSQLVLALIQLPVPTHGLPGLLVWWAQRPLQEAGPA